MVAASLPTASFASAAGIGSAAARPTPAGDPGPAVSGVAAVRSHFVTPDDQAARPFQATATTWPSDADVTVASGSAEAAAPSALSASQASPPVTVHVLAHDKATAANVSGVLMTVTPNSASPNTAVADPGRVRLSLAYSGFAQAYGGDYGARLSMVAYPSCILTTPAKAECRVPTPLASVNDQAKRTVSAQIKTSSAAAPMVVAATSSAGTEGGAGGTYAATTLKPSGSWTSGGSSGSFTYTYPMTVPPASTSLTPKVGLAYDSGSVDGQTAGSQTQASWAGDGWSTGDSFIEQSFVPCSDSPEGSASPVSSSDQCYDGQILTMSLNGSSTALVWDASKNVWKAAGDSGMVITHVTGSNNGSGTYNTDYWNLTDRSGATYSFGRNRLPGWSAGKPTTNSVDSVPVYSAHSGDPCYNAAGFSSSVCTMAYRWHLDYVTSAGGRAAMAYYYNQDTNYYGENNGAANVSYVRDSHLARIDYGFTDGGAFGTVPDQVVFHTADRCVSGTCDPLNSTTKTNWPDVPFDLVCASGATCSSYSPAFFSTVRLASVSTSQYSTAAAGYVTVDSWTLAHTLPATGDSTSPTLWLASVQHTGSDTTAGGSTSSITLPAVSFAGVDLANRVDTTTDGLPPLYRYRISAITTETGSVISPSYGQTAACTAPVTIAPAANTSSCYPVYWTPSGYTQPYLDWFNKYVVTSVTQSDPTGGAPLMQNSYTYVGGAAWHYDVNEVVKAKYRTYGQFRGYGDVRTFGGDGANDQKSESETTYYRGMSNNNNTTAVTLSDSAGGTHDDADELAGEVLETTAYLGSGGPVDHSTITSYWVSAPLATRNRTGLPAMTAKRVAAAETYSRQAVTSSGTTSWRYTETDTTYDATVTDANFGLTTAVYTHTVPVNPAYDSCTTSSYAAPNVSANIVGLVAETETDHVACGGFTQGSPASVPANLNTLTAPATVSRPAQVASDVRTYYDDPTFATTFPQAAPPSRGDVTMTRQAKDYADGAFVYNTASRTTYDGYGRVAQAYDGNGNLTGTTYTVDSVGLSTGQQVTNALNQTASTTLDTQRALPLTATDANGVTVTTQYDALGRTTSIWLASRTAPAPANELFAYQVSNTGLTAVTTSKLNDESAYQTSVQIYDALLRSRQTQTITPMGGRMVSDTFYDSRGWTKSTNNGWWDKNTLPAVALISPVSLNDPIPNQDFLTHDGLGRTVIDASAKNGATVSTTTTIYNGDRTTVIPPTGGVISSTLTDPLGRSVELDQYSSTPAVNAPVNPFSAPFFVTGGTFTATTYGFDGHGNQSTVTDAANNTWTTTFNLLGQATAKSDPDAGATTGLQYDGAGNLLQTTDSRGKTISYTYDALNRKTGEYDAPVSSQSAGNELASWAYDNSNNAVAGMTYPVGHLTTSTSYDAGAAYVNQVSSFNIFGEPLGETVTIPAAEGAALAGTYTYSHIYTPTVGLPMKDVYPAAGGLPSETVLHSYAGTLDLPNTVNGLSGNYLSSTTYDAWSRISQLKLNAAPNFAYVTDTYDDHTGRLTDQHVTRAVATPSDVDEQSYTYNLAGNPISQTSTRMGSPSSAETQCFSYDGLTRLTGAWTATDNCATIPTTGAHSQVADNLGPASTYWTTWQYDALGQRQQQIQHTTGSGPDTTTAYTYNGNGTGQPHTLTGTSTTGGATAGASYSYDTSGNMKTRSTPTLGSQSLTFNDLGKPASITAGSAKTTYVYDADGNILLQKDPTTTTLYLPAEQITLTTATNATTGVRYYALPGGTTAYRTGAGTSYGFEVATDQHGTKTLMLDNTGQVPTWRQSTPFGEARGGSTSWVDNRGFLNKPADTSTGLTEIGARQYDPTVGRFISLDPVFEQKQSQQVNGYTYAGENPVGASDPTGLTPVLSCPDDDPRNGGCKQASGGNAAGSAGDSYQNNTGEGGYGDQAVMITPDGRAIGGNADDPALVAGKPLRPSQTNALAVQYGYKGSSAFTWKDAAEFAQYSEMGWGYVCEGVMGLSHGACKHDPFTGSKDIWHVEGLVETIKDARGFLATIGAYGGCLVPDVGWATCGLMQAGAYAMRTDQKVQDGGGFDKNRVSIGLDGLITMGGIGAGKLLDGLKGPVETTRLGPRSVSPAVTQSWVEWATTDEKTAVYIFGNLDLAYDFGCGHIDMMCARE
ncbi:RHS repeat-associated core domain-containing protein [Catenulispora subtropica]|uniref:RHS repeat-associated core domain-containing protein n=1 Tax=Catenulispora subtropica TaxID=450798 RepID=A0ABN2QS91_9ACTN